MINIWADFITKFLQVFLKGEIPEDSLGKYLSVFTFVVFCSRINLALRVLLSLALSLLLLLSAATFSTIEFLEALVDSNIVGLTILEALCFEVMYQLA